MKHITSALAWANPILLSVLLAGCGGGDNDNSGTPIPPATYPPIVAAQPQSQSVLTDASAVFTVSANPNPSDSGTGLSYQWRKNGANIAGATAPTYTTPPASYQDNAAQYTVVVTGARGSVTSMSAQLTLVRSANQQAIESLLLTPNPGSYRLRWNLNYSGGQIVGTNYAYSDHMSLSVSPLTHGPQVSVQSAPQNITASLNLSNLVNSAPIRVLKNGSILVVPGTQESVRVSYEGSNIKVESLAADNTTEAFTEIRSDYSSIPLSGLVSAAPGELAHWYNSFFSNAAILNPSATFQAGAAYLMYTATNRGDRYNVFDCVGTTTGANVAPCLTGTTLTAALTTGMVSNSDARTYHLADGTMTTVGGISMWIATAERPQAASLSSIVQHRIYFEMNGNVYTGALIRNGTRVGGSYWVSNPAGATVQERLTYMPYQIRLNQAAHDSIVSALNI